MSSNGGAQKEATHWKVLGELAGSGLLFSAILFLLGFLSVRAYFNLLGLPVDLATSTAEYLAAGLRLMVTSLLAGAWLIIYATIPLVLVLATAAGLRARGFSARLRERLRRQGKRPIVFLLGNGLLLLTLAAFLLPFLQHLDQTGLLFVEPSSPLAQKRTAAGESGLERSYLMLQAVCLLSVFLAWSTITKLNRWHRGGALFTVLILALVAGQFLLLPINYGVLMMSTDFPRIREMDRKAVQAPLFLLGSDALGRRLLYDRSRRAVVLVPNDNAPLVLGPRENVFRDDSTP